MMSVLGRCLVICITCCCLQLGLSSYLSYPRINFAGKFRADSNTHNNDICNYRLGVPPNPNIDTLDWSINGTNEIEFVDAKVTSVFDKEGKMSKTDNILDQTIIGNLDGLLAKISDCGYLPDHFTMFGMKFGIKWTEEFPHLPDHDDIAFHGSWTRSIITQFTWPRIPCYDDSNYGKNSFQTSTRIATQFTTTVTDIEWSDLDDPKSVVLSQMREAVGDNGKLSVRVTMYYTTRNYAPYVARNGSLGYVVGSIGVHDKFDTINVPGRRGMFVKDPPVGLTFGEEDYEKDICSTYNKDKIKDLQWTNFAPFEVGMKNMQPEVRIDLSNSLPTHFSSSLRDIGTLKIGIMQDSCVKILNENPLAYTDNDEYRKTSGIFSVAFDSGDKDRVANNPLVLVQVLDTDAGNTKICGFPSDPHSVQILLEEYPYYIRPMGYYNHFLEKLHNPTSSQSVYVTKYGVAVTDGRVTALQTNKIGPPDNGVIPVSKSVPIKDGIAEFIFIWNEDASEKIPLNRKFYKKQCDNTVDTLPLDGQLYFFYFCLESEGVNCDNYKYITAYVHAYAEVNYEDKVLTWVDDVRDILSQYAQLSPMMTKIIDMGNYSEVVIMKHSMIMALENRDFDDPAYMPTTRDLSTAKRNMILKWLKSAHPSPLFDSEGTDPITEGPLCPSFAGGFVPPKPRCGERMLPFAEPPEVLDDHFKAVLNAPHFDDGVLPLECTPEGVMDRLQDAVSLEWATIPVYLTSLYSIIDGCNFEIYDLIHSVVMEEMLHMTQAANTLIAMGGKPLIDDASVAPSYPATGLPGGTLPGLNVTMERLSLDHIHKVFMSIEVPEYRTNSSDTKVFTIGRFYEEIKECIVELKDEDFQKSDRQVEWPYPDMAVVPVNSTDSAVEGIDMIVIQGEGAGLLKPHEIDDETYPHFYMFEAIVCQRHLVKVSATHYSYSGAHIPFNSEGVWPMRPNPDIASIPSPSNCYTESLAFHKVYRLLLRKLQEMFDYARPVDVKVAIELMQSLHAHAKKVMWTKFQPEGPGNDETCGPVWSYYWP